MPHVPYKSFSDVAQVFFIVLISLCLIIPSQALAVNTPHQATVKQSTTELLAAQVRTKKERKRVLRDVKRLVKEQYRAFMDTPTDSGKYNGYAIASCIFGVAGLFVAGFILGAVAIAFSLTAFRRILKGKGGSRGRGFAIAGLLLGIIAIAGAAIVVFE